MKSIYLYARHDREPLLAFTLAMAHDIPEGQRFIDDAGTTAQLEELKDTIKPGDTIFVGTITDFMTPTISDMLNTLEDFADDNITIRSLLEADYDIKTYRPAIRLAHTIYRVKMGYKPI